MTKKELWDEIIQARNELFGDMCDTSLYTISYGSSNHDFWYNSPYHKAFNEVFIVGGEAFPDLDTAIRRKLTNSNIYGYEEDEEGRTFFFNFDDNTVEFCNYIAFIIECHKRGVCKYSGIVRKESFTKSSEPQSSLYFTTEEEMNMFYDMFYDRLLEYSKLC